MKKMTILLAAVTVALASPTYAQTSPTASSVVTFTTAASMPSLRDKNAKDTFIVGLTDTQVAATIKLNCEAGGSKFVFLHKDKACSVSGNGSIINPANKQLLPRTQYMGGYVVKQDGTTDGSTMIVNYLALGKAQAAQTPFSGSLNLKPELTSSGAAALTQAVLKKLNTSAGGNLIDSRVDTVDLNSLYIPSAGFPSDKGCTWSGNMVFAYQTNSWFLDLRAGCNGKDYSFKGNMPWTETSGVADQTEYNLTLTSTAAATPATDDSLFASTSGDAGNADLFSTVDGISGHIVMKQSNMVTVQIDGKDTSTPSQVDATGTLTGNNIPVDTVRSLGLLFGILSENLFGA